MDLTTSQSRALFTLKQWYYSPNTKAILHGAAGTGKSFLINRFLKELGNTAKPLLLADTNEAVNVIRKATFDKYPCNTVCGALGLVLSTDNEKQHLVKRASPDLRKYNLIIVDEASQLDEERIQYIEELPVHILYVGHKSQLPPVVEGLAVNDKCVSPIFEKGYTTVELTEPVRNTGAIYTFCDKVEKLIYERGIVPYEFKVNPKFITEYLQENSDRFCNKQAVYLAFTNKRVKELCDIVRRNIFGSVATTEKFIMEDKLIFRAQALLFTSPLNGDKVKVRNLRKSIKISTAVLSTNTRATVQAVGYKVIAGVTCYELYVKIEADNKFGYVYTPMDMQSFEQVRSKLYYVALYAQEGNDRHLRWKDYHDFNMLLSDIRHAYALTVHCSQGSTIEDVFVDDKNLDLCRATVLKKKLRYVAYSRAKENLFRA